MAPPRTVEGVGALIIGIIVVGWLAYLLPWYLKNWEHPVEVADDAVDRFADSMVIVRRSDEEHSEDADAAPTEISTPLLRSAAREDIAIRAHTAVRRRRIGLIINMVVLALCAAAPFVLAVPGWVGFVGPVMLVCWVIVSHASVRIVNRRLDRGIEALRHGWDEQTTVLSAPQTATVRNREVREQSIDLSKPIDLGQSLPEPMPVAPMTYVNRPPRSVRPIDLAAPVVRPTAPRFPVTDTYPQDALPFGSATLAKTDGDEVTTSRAVGE